MTLEQTIPLMTSDDYRERFRAEYFQLKIRIERLRERINGSQVGLPIVPLKLLRPQLTFMICYLDALKVRAEAERISLEE